MKKLLVILLGVVIISSFMIGCTNNSTEEAAGSKEYVLKYGMVAGNQSNEYKAAKKLANLVKEKSDGQLKIELFPNSQLGDDRAMLEQVKAGALDITLAQTSRLGIWIPRARLIGLPYMVDSYEHLRRALYETEYGKKLRKEAYNKYNWKIVGNAYNGTRQTSSNRPIKSIEDMKGLKLRTPQAEILLDYAKYAGATPTPMAFTEVYLGLKTNSVDAQENPLSTIKAMKFYEVQDYIAMTNHVINDANYIVGKSTLKKLPPELKTILKDSIKKAAEHHTSLFKKEEKNLIDFFKKEGVTITRPDLAPFKKAVSKSYDKYLKKIGDGAQEALEQIKEVR